MDATQTVPALIWIALAVAAVVLIAALFRMIRRNQQVTSNDDADRLHSDFGQREREVATDRTTSRRVPDPATELERTMLMDAIERKFVQTGSHMPDSIRTMLNTMTVDEIKESIGNML